MYISIFTEFVVFIVLASGPMVSIENSEETFGSKPAVVFAALAVWVKLRRCAD